MNELPREEHPLPIDRPLNLLLIVRKDLEQRPRLALPQGSLAEVASADSVEEAEAYARLALFDAVVIDGRGGAGSVTSGAMTGTLRRILDRDPLTRVLVLLDDGARDLAAEAAAGGAWLVVAGGETEKDLSRRVEDAGHMRRLLQEAGFDRDATADLDCSEIAEAEVALPVATPAEDEEELQMVGSSETIRRVFGLLRQVASADVPVLITGESGTGKELAAIAIHERSARADGPFVAINCAAIPEQLLESELFGYEKGAFTGATQARKGRFETADGGTLFLDEVGDLAPLLQVKLLRFLQDHLVERLGGRRAVPLDVRVIAATNRDITAMVQRGEFREDLYFRLAVITIHLPPLRERGEDVVLMAQHFLQRYGKESPHPLRGYAPEAIETILEHPWRGNVRELINRVRRAVVCTEGPWITPSDLGLAHDRSQPLPTLREARCEAEARIVRAALRRANWNKVEAAQLLGISRAQLYELLSKLGIPPHEWG